MSATELQLRNSAFGGFHKQDVLDYIDRNNKEHAERLAASGRELDELRRAKEALEAEAKELGAKVEHLTAEGTRLTDRLEEANRAGEEAAADRDALSARVAAQEGELTQLKARLAKAEPAAEAYESIKDRTAGVELEAHHRANAVQEAAQEQVRKTRGEVEQWLHRMQGAYSALCAEMDGHVAAAAEDLNKVCRTLEGISTVFETEQTALEHLSDLCRDSLGPKPPQPLPLDGDEA